MFEFRDGSVFDGAMFRSWGRGDWGDEHWNGGWNGSDNDTGEYVILSAQYGSERRHVEGKDQLREMARQDLTFRVDYRTVGRGPDERNGEAFRIFAPGAHGPGQSLEHRD